MRKLILPIKRQFVCLFLAAAFVFSVVSGCRSSTADALATVRVDYAYYNPLSLVLKEKKWLEEEFAQDGVKVEWVLSQGSNKALEFLNSNSIDFGSTAGAAALIGKANGNPIKSVYVYSKPEWTALVTQANSSINKLEDLKGKRLAATRGTDPYVFLLRALDSVGLSEKDVELIQLQHADGRAALEKGDVDAWAGLDPHMAKTEVEKGSRLFFRNPDWNTYGVLNVREAFAKEHPESVERVIRAYEKARKWSLENRADLKAIWAREAKLSDPVATKQLERVGLDNSTIGDTQKQAINAAGDVLKKSGVIQASTDVQKTVDELIDPQYVTKVSQQ
ncbi:aliphatic sulfonate ABC transporter substrate-binding protein [Leptolyngbya sp. FACHB-261]|uniref:aliphatic sulfonate ABC transporter substrate-binding protein n=1 Tax=Leptolyngbya sp. FACHB-261 TaxID=2692806 RepID=UPI001687D95E|nr:aliphatic sulfonate ABC transporter substrate-binding protein [Leptolyngbya sp. FACHB-261]MBD2104191.1 aliphatic sulfonate ABC transporter substrate-binding protein [Leptolyngbya sp. FACHB-261]